MSKLQSDLDRLAAESCASRAGNRCLLLPGNCIYFAATGIGRCGYFERSVLPADPSLQSRYAAQFQLESDQNIGTCASCGTSYEKRSNRQKYCGHCGESERRKRKAASERQRRAKQV
ncbi:hypothetical protein [Cytobacillus firmus]|uniref:hypothetical protein n=1 Tax=Cytobacillus firmus TaxID=1399 RepID=UPI001CFC4C07|nr:hypothetical protein [Cytobacillus firmus]